jgi:hypothetical protein
VCCEMTFSKLQEILFITEIMVNGKMAFFRIFKKFYEHSFGIYLRQIRTRSNPCGSSSTY